LESNRVVGLAIALGAEIANGVKVLARGCSGQERGANERQERGSDWFHTGFCVLHSTGHLAKGPRMDPDRPTM